MPSPRGRRRWVRVPRRWRRRWGTPWRPSPMRPRGGPRQEEVGRLGEEGGRQEGRDEGLLAEGRHEGRPVEGPRQGDHQESRPPRRPKKAAAKGPRSVPSRARSGPRRRSRAETRRIPRVLRPAPLGASTTTGCANLGVVRGSARAGRAHPRFGRLRRVVAIRSRGRLTSLLVPPVCPGPSIEPRFAVRGSAHEESLGSAGRTRSSSSLASAVRGRSRSRPEIGTGTIPGPCTGLVPEPADNHDHTRLGRRRESPIRPPILLALFVVSMPVIVGPLRAQERGPMAPAGSRSGASTAACRPRSSTGAARWPTTASMPSGSAPEA